MQKIAVSFDTKSVLGTPQKPLVRRVLSRRVAAGPASSVPPVAVDPASLPATKLAGLVDDYIDDCAIARHSAASLSNKRVRLGKLLWFVSGRGYEVVGEREVKQFFVYMNAPAPPGGRWGNRHCVAPLSTETVKAFFSGIRAFFRWCVEESRMGASPLARTKPPISRPDQVQPFNEEQVRALIAGAADTAYPTRDTALVLTLLDTGLRVSEVCALTHEDLNLHQGEIIVRSGKGGKRRVVPIGRATRVALIEQQRAVENFLSTDAVFVSERGRESGAALGAVGLQRVIKRIAKRANVSGVRCSPHTFRHTFAVMFLRRGGNVFTLKQILGHESLEMTNRYVAVAQADVAAQHREFSPVEGLRLGKKKAR